MEAPVRALKEGSFENSWMTELSQTLTDKGRLESYWFPQEEEHKSQFNQDLTYPNRHDTPTATSPNGIQNEIENMRLREFYDDHNLGLKDIFVYITTHIISIICLNMMVGLTQGHNIIYSYSLEATSFITS